uniref:Uncharacterized protein n=1 Tax=Lygus hesperus TaxID=30085 RepID=A0A146LIJ6_LYGHE
MAFFYDTEQTLPLRPGALLGLTPSTNARKRRNNHIVLNKHTIALYLQQPRSYVGDGGDAATMTTHHNMQHLYILLPNTNVAGVALALALQFQYHSIATIHTIDSQPLLSFV